MEMINLKEVTRGKSKIVYHFPYKNAGDYYILQFTGDQTVNAQGELDPGANFVAQNIPAEEKAEIADITIRMSEYYFRLLEKHGIKTHFVSADLDKLQMTVKIGTPIGRGMECIVRYFSYGSFVARYGDYPAFAKGEPIYVREFHHKNDAAGDPPLTLDIILAGKILTHEEYDELYDLLGKAIEIIHLDLAGAGLTLIDIKIEFMRGTDENGNSYWMVADEIAAGSMRVALDGVEIKDKKLLAKLILDYALSRKEVPS
ncbi:phosphoribosylaminoimidazolesuccinocarboxamide synthase [Microgenomates group bacterium]|nr:phosphoribosylaminoimidazolesuccinocarboxamide synthase [Microgenomates group bacterium]